MGQIGLGGAALHRDLLQGAVDVAPERDPLAVRGEERRHGAFRAPNERRLQLSAVAQIEPSVRSRGRLGGWRASIDQVRTVARHRDGACVRPTDCRRRVGGSGDDEALDGRRKRSADAPHDAGRRQPPTMNVPIAHGSTIGQRARGTGIVADAASGRAGLGASNAPASANETSPISRTRCLRSFCRHRRITVTTAAGDRGGQRRPVRLLHQDARQRVGDVLPLERAPGRSAFHRARPQTPTRRCACRPARPFACSGLMYAAVPRIIPTPVIIAGDVIVGDIDGSPTPRPSGSSAFASPKSSTFTVPSARSLMFAGFRSRWMIPCSCAASSASAICFAIGSASSSGIGPARSAAPGRRPRPAPSRARSRRRPPQDRGWPRCWDGSVRRGLRLRAGTAPSLADRSANASGRILMATSRLSFVSVAR